MGLALAEAAGPAAAGASSGTGVRPINQARDHASRPEVRKAGATAWLFAAMRVCTGEPMQWLKPFDPGSCPQIDYEKPQAYRSRRADHLIKSALTLQTVAS